MGDRGEVHGGAGNDKMNTMLTYRDACYYEFINSNQFQFPLANLYNHDPIYGKEGTGITADSMDGEQFRNYLFMQGTRGTAFWELYYSDSLFNDEKYLINADFLAWEEGNFDMLRNAKWIGGDPASNAGLTSNPTVNTPGTQEAYGFSGSTPRATRASSPCATRLTPSAPSSSPSTPALAAPRMAPIRSCATTCTPRVARALPRHPGPSPRARRSP